MAGTTVIGTFPITLEGSLKTSELVKQGKEWFDDWITDGRFPIKEHAPLDRTIELLEFDHDPSNNQILEELLRRGLERPTYEHALYFGIKHPEEQRKRPIIFLHEPVRGKGGSLYVLVLREEAGHRGLYLYGFETSWNRGCAFAGVRKQL
ncbi:MAG: hypothetical protein Greene071421_354 [Parcubacteria group bacterium Greene0714_21]|nr:MAG: hypothetical protein Greene041639_7 [Parcubacteria group bacterium Greene0416_39]TSC98338.1 MAG: hypothetical protein Greene101447_81 [Parcubacteria group bacterium Greene1014_47]TSD03988.1 MAG: hypothetical protein Greene071421_354 [Parcubacteria group bacterium Greene0714_21]